MGNKNNYIPKSALATNIEIVKFVEKLSEDLRTPIKQQLREIVLNTFVPLFSKDFNEENDNVLIKLLEHKSYFFQGRRGTGKSFYFIYSQHKLEKEKNKISIYLDLKDIYRAIPGIEKSHLIFTFYLKIFILIKGELSKRINKLRRVFNKNKSGVIDELDNLLEDLNEKMKYFSFIQKYIDLNEEFMFQSQEEMDQKRYKQALEKLNTKINQNLLEVYNDIKDMIRVKDDELSNSIKELSREVFYILHKIKENFNVKIYLLLDEFSDIVPSRRDYTSLIQKIFFEHLFIPLTEMGIIFKIAVYPEDNFLTSEIFRSVKISIEDIDLSYYLQTYSYENIMKQGAKVLEELLEKKFIYYNKILFGDQKHKYLKFNNIFSVGSDNSDFLIFLFKCVFGSVRNLGYILYNIYETFKETSNFIRINFDDIIKAAIKYFDECERSLKSDRDKNMLFHQESYNIWDHIKKYTEQMKISSKMEQTKGIFHIPLENTSDDVKLQLRDVEGHSLINFLFTKSSKHDDSRDPLNLYVYRMNQGFLMQHKWIGKYEHDCRAKKYSIDNIFEKKKTIECDNGHEKKIEELKKSFNIDDPNHWICTIFIPEEKAICGAKYSDYLSKWEELNKKKDIKQKLEKILEDYLTYYISDSELTLAILEFLYNQNKRLSSREIANAKPLERYETDAYQVAGILRRKFIKEIITKDKEGYLFDKTEFIKLYNQL
ncbi:MAG: hypothetical protein ACFFBP_00685 [Promethearchaeota archaeon]